MCIKGNKNYPGRKIVILTLITLRRVVILQTFNTLWSVPLTVQTDSASTGIGLPLHDVHLRCETAVLTPARTLRLTQLRKSTAAPCGGGRALNKRGRRGPAPRSTQSPAARRSRRGEEEEGRRPAARHEARARPHGGGAPRGERSGPSPDTGRGRRAHTGARTPPPFSEAARARALQAGGGGGEGTAPRAEKGGAKGGGESGRLSPIRFPPRVLRSSARPGLRGGGDGTGRRSPWGEAAKESSGHGERSADPTAGLPPASRGGRERRGKRDGVLTCPSLFRRWRPDTPPSPTARPPDSPAPTAHVTAAAPETPLVGPCKGGRGGAAALCACARGDYRLIGGAVRAVPPVPKAARLALAPRGVVAAHARCGVALGAEAGWWEGGQQVWGCVWWGA